MILRFQVESQNADWLADGALARVLAPLADAGWIGDVAWMQVNWKAQQRPRAIPRGPTQVEQIAALLPRSGASRALEVGGDAWSLHLLLAQYDVAADEVDGMNLCTLDFDLPDDDACAPDAFAAAARTGLADYGYLAPREQEARQRRDARRDRIIADQILPCVYWCNYVSPRWLALFDRARLEAIAALRVEWSAVGLVLVAAPTPAAALAPEGEAAMLALTDRFREARTPHAR